MGKSERDMEKEGGGKEGTRGRRGESLRALWVHRLLQQDT